MLRNTLMIAALVVIPATLALAQSVTETQTFKVSVTIPSSIGFAEKTPAANEVYQTASLPEASAQRMVQQETVMRRGQAVTVQSAVVL